MISRRTSSVLKEDVVFPRLLYCDPRCSQTCCRRTKVCCRRTQVRRLCTQVLAGMSTLLPSVVAGAPSYSEGRQEGPPRVSYSAEIEGS
jgi:hypothetical protein